MISTVALFWALCVVCIVNMARYFSSLRALLVVLRGCDPLLYQYVDGGGFFTSHGQPSKQMRLVGYIYYQRYRDHHDEEFIRRCERLRRQFILTSALCGLVVLAGVAAALEAIDAHRIAANALGLERVAHRGAFVDDLDASLMQCR